MTSDIGLTGFVEVFDGRTGELLYRSPNHVIADGKKLVMDFLRGESVEGIKVLALEDTDGEIFRKAPTGYSDTSDSERVWSFFLTEDEPADPPHSLVALKLVGDDATVALDTGVDYARLAYTRAKGVNQSLLVNWTTRVVV